jgi:hypothetical protein
MAAPAFAMTGPSTVDIDGGPLGPLEISAGVDGYLYGQSGTSDHAGNSVVGDKAGGAEVDAFMAQLAKTTGIIQFSIQAAQFTNINLGANKPKEINNGQFTTSPLRSAFVTLAFNPSFQISIGQFNSLEGYESVFAWDNPVALRTVIAAVENSDSRGVEVNFNQGDIAAAVIFGDGYDTGVFNYLQYLTTLTINGNNDFNLFGGFALGVTGPNAFAYGEAGAIAGGPDGVGGQGQLANVNSNMFGAWYDWHDGDLKLTPEIQFQYAKPLHRYADILSGGLSDDIAKQTSNLATAVFADYKFGQSPYSLGAWIEYATSHGSGAQDTWFVAPNAELVGFAIAPTWQGKFLFTRLNLGYAHLLNNGSPEAGFGNAGMGRDQVVGTVELGLLL